MRKLKIAFYTDTYLPTVDGVVTSIIETRRELERRGHEVYIFAVGSKDRRPPKGKDEHLFVVEGLKFRRYPQYSIAFRNTHSDKIRSIQPDIIHSHTPFSMGILAYGAKKSTGAKLVSTFHTLVFSDELLAGYLSSNPIVMRLGKFAMIKYLEWIYGKSDAVIAPTRYILRVLKRQGIKCDDVIPTGLVFPNRARMSKTAARKKLGLKKNDKVMLYLGRISREKDIEFLIKSAESLGKHGFKIIIAGAGPYVKECRDLADKLGVENIRFPGFVNDVWKPYFYSSADIFCNPSLFETQSLVDVEAMHYGVPILAPSGTAQAEILDDGVGGETFRRHDTKDLVRKALAVMNNRKKYNPKSVAGRFSIDKTVDKLLELYAKLLGD